MTFPIPSRAAILPPLLLLSGLPLRAPAAEEGDKVVYALKAAFLVNIAKFVEWPSEAFPAGDAPIVIGIIGKDPFGKLLDVAAEGKMVDRRKIVVRRLPSAASEACHILFISPSEKDRRSAIQEAYSGKSVLMVAEFPDFVEKEGAVQFEEQGRKVRLAINLGNAKERSLKVSSLLLRLARIVQKPGPQAES